jgi:hypothetical protein
MTNAGNLVSRRRPPHRLTYTGTQLLVANTISPIMIVTQMSIFKNRIGPQLLLISLPYGKFNPLGSAIH